MYIVKQAKVGLNGGGRAMRTSREQVEQNREVLLEAAGRGYRRLGFDGVRVADVMQEAGLTHGGFYGYFASKEDMAAQAFSHYFGLLTERLRGRVERGETLAEYAERYLSRRNRDHPDQACLFSSLSGEVARQPDAVRRAYTEGLEAYLAEFTNLTGNRADAIAAFATLIGAMSLARAVDDDALSREILEAGKRALDAAR
ncbi:MAG TPA: TetR/AcrR family transcriptional regulator [Gemmatimonas sp.]|uniref:TetR/AcrR family transcriptional regulator n=1 Tax=Gemmatimonas sp. TaxID=1962908 RepID=UPI002ED8B937